MLSSDLNIFVIAKLGTTFLTFLFNATSYWTRNLSFLFSQMLFSKSFGYFCLLFYSRFIDWYFNILTGEFFFFMCFWNLSLWFYKRKWQKLKLIAFTTSKSNWLLGGKRLHHIFIFENFCLKLKKMFKTLGRLYRVWWVFWWVLVLCYLATYHLKQNIMKHIQMLVAFLHLNA